IQQLRQAGLRGADDTPGDPVARLRQAGEGALEAHDAGSTFASGTTTLSKNSAEVTDARSENLRSISGASNPGVPFSTMKPRIPSSVCAHTTHRSAIAPFVIHIFAPLITQSLPRRFACV